MKLVPVLLLVAAALALTGCPENKGGDAKPAGSGAPSAASTAKPASSGAATGGW